MKNDFVSRHGVELALAGLRLTHTGINLSKSFHFLQWIPHVIN